MSVRPERTAELPGRSAPPGAGVARHGFEQAAAAPTRGRFALRRFRTPPWSGQQPTYRDADPAVIAAAYQRALGRSGGNWYVVGASREVPAARPVGRRVAGVEVVLWRDAAGRLRAGPGACPHLGAPLADAAVHDGLLVCRWHGLALSGERPLDQRAPGGPGTAFASGAAGGGADGTARAGDADGTARAGDADGTARAGDADGTARPGGGGALARAWCPLPAYDDGVLAWVRLDRLGGQPPTERPPVPARPTGAALDAVATVVGRCEPRDVVCNRLDPWHGAWFHPYSFANLRVRHSPPAEPDLPEERDVFTLEVTYRVAGRLGVPVLAEFSCPGPRTVLMRIVAGEGTGSVVETHATPIGAGADGAPRTAVVEAVVATSPRPGFALARAAAPVVRPAMAWAARRLWRDDIAYAERTYALRADRGR